MSDADLDSVDRAIIHALQADARHTSSSTIAEEVGVSASTVRNRIGRLEEAGIVRGYHADIDYERAGYQLYTLIVCTAPIPDREELARAALDIEGVVSVREVMTGAENVHIGVVGTDGDDLSRIGRELNDLGFDIVDEDLIRNDFSNPYHGFERTN
jgi:DNA-binding Lrp family transcriptional regulator